MNLLWLDAHDYGARLLRGGSEPWLAPARLGPFYGELAALLNADRLVVPIAPLLSANLADKDDGLNRAEALDRAVQSDTVMVPLATGLATLAHGSGARMLVPLLPGPTGLGCDPTDEDSLDDCVAALAVLLRQLVSVSLSGTILIDELDASACNALGPLRRIAEHGGVSMRLIGGDLDTIAWDALEGRAGGCEALVQIPADSEPEAVLARLAAVRSAERPS